MIAKRKPDARLMRDMNARRLLASRTAPDLPIDGDAIETRVPTPMVGTLLDGIVTDLLVENSPFFDEVCEKWTCLFPEIAARPGRWQDGRLFLYVGTSGQLFALRPRLAKMKKTLSALATAPKRFSLHLEIHAR